jgi:hypothetical protein
VPAHGDRRALLCATLTATPSPLIIDRRFGQPTLWNSAQRGTSTALSVGRICSTTGPSVLLLSMMSLVLRLDRRAQ